MRKEFLLLFCFVLIYSCMSSVKGFLKYNIAEENIKNRNYSSAIENYNLACSSGYGRACYELFKIYFEGRYGNKKNTKNAISYLKRGIKYNDDMSLVVASKFYQTGVYGFNVDYKKSYQYLLKASKKENPVAYYELGLLYLLGYPEYNLDKAIGYFKLAKVNGMPISFKMLSKKYLRKRFKKRDYVVVEQQTKQLSEKDILFKIQKKLKHLGYYKSKIDGIYGPGTKKAILNYQKDKGLEQTGKPSMKLLEILEKE